MIRSGLGELLLPRGYYRSEIQLPKAHTNNLRLGFTTQEPMRFLFLKEIYNEAASDVPQTNAPAPQPTWTFGAASPANNHAATAGPQQLGSHSAPESESNVLRTLDHPYVMRVEDNRAKAELRVKTVVCEYIPGPSARSLLEKGTVTPLLECTWDEAKQRLKQMIGIASAVVHIHQKKVKHCDICPDNMILSSDEMLHLLTFGARPIDQRRDDDETPTVIHEAYTATVENAPVELSTKTDSIALARTFFAWMNGSCQDYVKSDVYFDAVGRNSNFDEKTKNVLNEIGNKWIKAVEQWQAKSDEKSANLFSVVEGIMGEISGLPDGKEFVAVYNHKREKGENMGTLERVRGMMEQEKYIEYIDLDELQDLYWFTLRDVVRASENVPLRECFRVLLEKCLKFDKEMFDFKRDQLSDDVKELSGPPLKKA